MWIQCVLICTGSMAEKVAHGKEAFQMLIQLQGMLQKMYLGFQKGDNDVDMKEVADHVVKLEQSIGGGAAKRVGLSSILSGVDEGPEVPIKGMDDICEQIDSLERLQQLAEERGFSQAQDGSFEGIGSGDFDSASACVHENMLDDSFGTFVDGWSVFDITLSRYMNSEEYAISELLV